MFEPQWQFWDIAILVVIVAVAVGYLLRRLGAGGNQCGKGCGSCPSQRHNNQGQR